MSWKPRILIIENSVDITGALKSIGAMIKELSADFEFILIMPGGSRAIPWVTNNVSAKVYQLPMIEMRKSLVSFFFYLPALVLNSIRVRRIIRFERIDIVHSNDLYNLIPPLLKFFGLKFGYVCHIRFLPAGFPRWLFSFWLRRQLNAASKVFAVSDFLRRQLPDDPRIVTMHDRIFDERDAFTANDKNCILYLSNFIPGKGHDMAIKVIRRLHDRFPGWTLRFAGSDMGLEKNREYLQQLQRASDGVTGIEWNDVTHDVAAEYKDASFVLNFSNAESFSMTCLEAQYHGRAVVATRSGGPEEIIEDGVTGFLVPLNDVDAATNAIARLIENKDLRDRMGIAAAELMRLKFSRSATTSILERTYRELHKP